MFPLLLLPPAIASIAELVGSAIVTTVAARVASDLYDSATNRSSSAGSSSSDDTEAA
ncbi:hypothetical protein [Paraburkholderia solisilvae]|uniref:Uncharacterized protein n=1 Tax=Paraburkholderia solisilvae TaxID=624376 RepID=A0A6J5EFP3_9BURK|nr:hypothetical protein [Paraburkholderia solisilvae]CAB3764514.1 hypothetical protein LMG29739_04375 [Paraburkholderia solisilvae]